LLLLSPSFLVPCLTDNGLKIWDTLAIAEYLHEIKPKADLFPTDRGQRAHCRSICGEMHSGFTNLRSLWPMNARARNRRTAMTAALEADIERIDEIWNDCRARFGSGGPWLFGEYTIADAMYAPVVLRFNTYGAGISQTARWYMASVLEDAAVQEWLQGARHESWTNPASEVG
jgi:glutathione S-transferase